MVAHTPASERQSPARRDLEAKRARASSVTRPLPTTGSSTKVHSLVYLHTTDNPSAHIPIFALALPKSPCVVQSRHSSHISHVRQGRSTAAPFHPRDAPQLSVTPTSFPHRVQVMQCVLNRRFPFPRAMQHPLRCFAQQWPQIGGIAIN